MFYPIQEVQTVPIKINPRRNTPKIKRSNQTDKEKILKATRIKQ